MFFYQHHLISSAGDMDGGGNSTYHPLSGHANALYMCGHSSVDGFWYSFISTKTSGGTSGCAFVPPWTPVIIPCNYPTYVTLIDTGGNAFRVSIVEFF